MIDNIMYNTFITEEDFKKERERRDREELKRIERSKLNKQWLGYTRGYDTDYIPNPPVGMNE